MPKAKDVMLTTDFKQVENCKYLEDLSSEAPTIGDVTNLLKNNTATSGGDTFFQISFESTLFHTKAKGKAYDCRQKSPEKKTEGVTP